MCNTVTRSDSAAWTLRGGARLGVFSAPIAPASAPAHELASQAQFEEVKRMLATSTTKFVHTCPYPTAHSIG